MITAQLLKGKTTALNVLIRLQVSTSLNGIHLSFCLDVWFFNTEHCYMCTWSSFSRTHKIGNIPIYTCSIFPCLYHIILLNVKLDISGYERIKFQGHMLHRSSSFLMLQLKWSWQYWHSCIEENLWKTLLVHSKKHNPIWDRMAQLL